MIPFRGGGHPGFERSTSPALDLLAGLLVNLGGLRSQSIQVLEAPRLMPFTKDLSVQCHPALTKQLGPIPRTGRYAPLSCPTIAHGSRVRGVSGTEWICLRGVVHHHNTPVGCQYPQLTDAKLRLSNSPKVT